MMTDIRVAARITPDGVRSLTRVYERTPAGTTPADRHRVPFQTPGTTP
jgi:hypothetical protein